GRAYREQILSLAPGARRVEEGQDEKPKRAGARSSKGLDRGRGQRSSGQRPSGGVQGGIRRLRGIVARCPLFANPSPFRFGSALVFIFTVEQTRAGSCQDADSCFRR